jgi:hypothetical protein
MMQNRRTKRPTAYGVFGIEEDFNSGDAEAEEEN